MGPGSLLPEADLKDSTVNLKVHDSTPWIYSGVAEDKGPASRNADVNMRQLGLNAQHSSEMMAMCWRLSKSKGAGGKGSHFPLTLNGSWAPLSCSLLGRKSQLQPLICQLSHWKTWVFWLRNQTVAFSQLPALHLKGPFHWSHYFISPLTWGFRKLISFFNARLALWGRTEELKRPDFFL